MSADAVIRIQPLDGQWETLGVDRLRGIVPENIEASCNSWGPDTLNFVLKAEAGARRPDVLPFTPIDLELGGMLCWSGFVWQRPSDANGYSVGCRGWQYHLDDDLLDRVYVHTRLGDYRDQRSFLGANLGANQFTVSGLVSSDGGTILIGWPNGTVLGGGGANVGVTLDLGPDSVGKRVVLTYEATGGAVCVVRGTDGESYTGTGEDVLGFTTIASETRAGTFTAARRYIHIVLTTSGTLGDVHMRITGMKVFRATAYESGNASILKADTVLKDVLALAPLLNQSTTAIAAGTFSIPEWLTGGYLTPRQIAEAVNAYENYRLKIGGADLRQLVFDAKPAAPILEVGDWSGAAFSDATVSGEEIYDKAVVDATGPDGARLVVIRGSGHALGLVKQLTGFTFTLLSGSPAVPGDVQHGSERDPSFPVTHINFRRGFPYYIVITSATAGASGNTSGLPTTWRARFGDFGYDGVHVPAGSGNPPPARPGNWAEFNFTIPAGGTVGPLVAETFVPDRDIVWLESEITLMVGNVANHLLTSVVHSSERGTTLLDRRLIVRSRVLPISSAVTPDVAKRFADLWLLEHNTAPFAGRLVLTGASARRILGGGSVPAHELLLYAGEKIRLSNRLDPDTGGWGRDGRIAGVTYRHNDRQADVAIDDQRDRFESVLARYGVLVDQLS